MRKRIILGENELFKRVHPVLLNLFCRSVLKENSKRFVLGALVSVVTSPVLWILIFFRKSIHILILLSAWWFLRGELTQSISYVFVVLGLIGIFYRELYEELVIEFLLALVIVTGGGFLRWMCAGYLSGDGFRQQWFVSAPMEKAMASLVPSLQQQSLAQYNKIMNLYLESNQTGREERLNMILEEYEVGHTPI